MNWMLIAVGGILLVGILIGIWRGAIKIVVSLMTTILTLVLVYFATPYVADAIVAFTPLDEIIEEKIATSTNEAMTDFLSGDVEMKLVEEYAEDGLEVLSRDIQIAAISESDIPEVFKNLLLTNNNEMIYNKLGADSFVAYITKYVTKLVVHIIAFAITFIVVTILMSIIVFALKIASHLPVLGAANRLAGGALGAVGALLIVWAAFAVITIFYSSEIGKELLEMIKQEALLRTIYEYNPILRLILMFK